MGSMSGILQRPLVAAAAVAVASVSSDLSDKLQPLKSSETSSTLKPVCDSPVQESDSPWVSHVSLTKLSHFSFVSRVRVPLPAINNHTVPHLGSGFASNLLPSSVVSSPTLLNLYQSAELAKAPNPTKLAHTVPVLTSSDVLYRWHLPEPNACDGSRELECSFVKSKTVVVLLGWLGARQKHLKRYAELYTSMGFHAITFTFPMAEVLSYKIGGKAEQNVDLLVNHLAEWLEEEHGKNLVFHTFSNTGWLTYGAILEKFQEQDPTLTGRIKGCIVDSAPVAAPDPQVWASGFSAAFLKTRSVATKGTIVYNNESGTEEAREVVAEPKIAITEAVLLVVLEKLFQVVLNLPSVNRRLSDVLGQLSSRQPNCPQLYIYSSADRVIPAGSVEMFIEEQRKAGREVRACNFISTPHVDHFRNDPKLYTYQLTQFLDDCVLNHCKYSS